MKQNNDITFRDIPKKHGFTTPDRYFEQLPTRVMQRTAGAASAGAPATGNWFWQVKTAMAGSAMALVFILSFLATHTWEMAQLQPNQSLTKISDVDIQQYLLNNAELESTDLAEFAAIKAPQALEFIEVRHQDVNLDAAMEVMEDKEEFQSIESNEY